MKKGRPIIDVVNSIEENSSKSNDKLDELQEALIDQEDIIHSKKKINDFLNNNFCLIILKEDRTNFNKIRMFALTLFSLAIFCSFLYIVLNCFITNLSAMSLIFATFVVLEIFTFRRLYKFKYAYIQYDNEYINPLYVINLRGAVRTKLNYNFVLICLYSITPLVFNIIIMISVKEFNLLYLILSCALFTLHLVFIFILMYFLKKKFYIKKIYLGLKIDNYTRKIVEAYAAVPSNKINEKVFTARDFLKKYPYLKDAEKEIKAIFKKYNIEYGEDNYEI